MSASLNLPTKNDGQASHRSVLCATRRVTADSRSARLPPNYGWQIHIELLDVTPTVWRRLLIPIVIGLPLRMIEGTKFGHNAVLANLAKALGGVV